MPADNGNSDGRADVQAGEAPEVVLPEEFTFPNPTDETGYRVFPDEMENDPLIFFHGTAAANLRPIMAEGFRPERALASISFARTSSLALRYACESRTPESPEGCIIMVRFSNVGQPGIKEEGFGVHVYDMGKLPEIIGYCIVPGAYAFR